MTKPYSESCDQNKDPILSVLKTVFIEPMDVFEIGSGTGQHAVYFSSQMSHIMWQPSDREENIAGIQSWVDESTGDNVSKSQFKIIQ
jgi:hypothetical protein